MDGKHFEPDSNFLPEKRCDDGIDRISELLDEIILVILSFLPFWEAATTSVLSSRWLDLWKHIPILNLDAKLLTNHYQKPTRGRAWDAEIRFKYIKIVNSILQSYKAPSLKEFRISWYANKSSQCTVAKWLEFVVSRQVERLELDFLCEDTINYRVSLSLEELLRDRPQNVTGFKSLKSLCLKGFNVSGKAIDSFLRNCPLLEELYIHGSILTSDIVVCGTALALKHFDIYHCYALSDGKHSIKVCAPNLTWLRLYTTHKLVLENIPKLSSAEYSCAFSAPGYVKQFASSVFSCVSRLEILNLNLRSSCKVFFANGFPQMPKLKKLAVRYGYGPCGTSFDHGVLPLTALIRASPRLQEFKLQLSIHPRSKTTWKGGTTNGESDLKVFEFTGFSEDASDQIGLLKYILDNCVVLEKIILGFPSMSRFFDNLEREPRAARDRLERLLDGKVPHHVQLCLI